MKKVFILLAFISLSNCQKKDNDLEYEKKVMNEIFIDLVDSIFTDMRTLKIPPPYLENGISDSLRNEKMKKYSIALEENEKRIKEIKNDTSRIVIVVFDTIEKQSIIDGEELIKDNNIEYLFNPKTKKIEYKIDLDKLKKSDKYIFKYYSSFPNKQDIFRSIFSFSIGGVVSFSRIQFDKDRNFGVLIGGISYGRLNGAGYRIFIKKDLSGKWIVEKKKGISIS